MAKTDTFDEKIMRRALALARRGRAWVAPNPMVGAVVVRDGVVVGEGYHRRFGGPHAEVNALWDAGDKAKGATLYVTLEPCSHHGKTPPCVDRIIPSGVTRVVVALQDPNPLVNGAGLKRLREAGLDVEVGVLAAEAEELNQPYLKKAATGRAYVTLKMAMSLDGRIASVTGHSQWISGKKSLRYAHMMRASHDAVLVGAGTVRADDPQLTVRHVPGRNPVRIVLDTNFRISPDCKLLNSPDEAETWVFGAPENGEMPPWAERRGVRAFIVERDARGILDLTRVLDMVSELGVMSIMVEGGSGIWTSFLERGLVDKIEAIIAPMIIGHGIDAVGDLKILKVHDAIRLQPFRWRRIGQDLHVAARVVHEQPEAT